MDIFKHISLMYITCLLHNTYGKVVKIVHTLDARQLLQTPSERIYFLSMEIRIRLFASLFSKYFDEAVSQCVKFSSIRSCWKID